MPQPVITVTWRIPAELHGRLREAAQQAGQSMNGLVVAGLTKYLEGCEMKLSKDDLRRLGKLTTRNEAGVHFTQNPEFPSAWLDRMEQLGFIKIHRPVHAPSGIPYSPEHWTVEVTPKGLEVGEAKNWGE